MVSGQKKMRGGGDWVLVSKSRNVFLFLHRKFQIGGLSGHPLVALKIIVAYTGRKPFQTIEIYRAEM